MIKQKGMYIILSSPSGAGKTSLAKKIIKKNKNFELSISYTTRQKRQKEIDKKDYYFISKKMFDFLKKRNFFIEYAKVFNNYYGTSLEKTKKVNNLGKDILFDIDWQGSRKIKKKLTNGVISIFILPPSKKELTRRLNKRAQDPKDVVKQRLLNFKTELSHWKEYKYVLINDNLEKTTNKIMKIINFEKKAISSSTSLSSTKYLNQIIKRLMK